MAVKIGGTSATSPAPELKIVNKPIKALIEYENNPRLNDSAVPEMVKLIEKFGFRQPILVRGNEIVDGHLRLKAARKLKMKALPAIDVSDMSETDVRALRLAMNKSAEFAEWDNEALAVEFSKLQDEGFELAFTGFETGVVDKILAEIGKAAQESPAPKKTKLADAGNPADPNYVALTFHMADSSRKAVIQKLDTIAEEHGLANRSQALIHLCKD